MKYLALVLLVGCASASPAPSPAPSDVEVECQRLVAELAAARDAGAPCAPSRARALVEHPTCKVTIHECRDGGR